MRAMTQWRLFVRPGMIGEIVKPTDGKLKMVWRKPR
jgi:hypothetical protein